MSLFKNLISIPLVFSVIGLQPFTTFNSIITDPIPSNKVINFSQINPTSVFNNKEVDANAVDWLWKGPNQSVKLYTNDFSLSKITTGWNVKGAQYFSKIDIQFENQGELKTVNFDTFSENSLRNVRSFSLNAIIKFGQRSTSVISGTEYERFDININYDSTFRFQTDSKDDLYTNVTPTMFGKGFNHDPRYNGEITFNDDFTQVQFNSVLQQRNDCGGYNTQCRDAFSQNPNTWYSLTTSVTGRGGFEYTAANTYKIANELHPYQGKFIDFQVDVWFVHGQWFAGFFWINHVNPQFSHIINYNSDSWNHDQHRYFSGVKRIKFWIWKNVWGHKYVNIQLLGRDNYQIYYGDGVGDYPLYDWLNNGGNSWYYYENDNDYYFDVEFHGNNNYWVQIDQVAYLGKW